MNKLVSAIGRVGLSAVLATSLSFIGAGHVSAAPTGALGRSGRHTQCVGPLMPAPSHVDALTSKPLAGGGKAYVYQIGGTQLTFPVPPPGFSPVSATNAQLREYGMPPRPITAPGLASWTRMMATYRRTPVPDIEVMTKAWDPSAQPTTSSPVGAASNSHWSGWLGDSNYQEFVAAQANYTQPTAENTSCTNSDETTWVGLGGWNSQKLVQDGTWSPTSSGTPCSSGSNYCAWYEYLNGTLGISATILSNVDVRAGNSIHSYVAYETSNGLIDYYVADNSTGTYQALEVAGVGTTYYDGSSADFIAERPDVNGSFTPLERFTTFSFSGAEGETTSGSWIPISSAVYPYRINMENGSTPLALPSSLNASGEGFGITWKNCN